jgi:hypothetical protein
MKNIFLPLAISIYIGITEAQVILPLISHDQVVQRRYRHLKITSPGTHNGIPIRRSLEGVDTGDNGDIIEVGELFQGYGTHYVDLWVGTEPQRQTVIVDTGSGVTAFPCKGCQDCGSSYHASAFFVEENSSTFQKLTCDTCQEGSCRNKGSSQEYCSLSVAYQEGSMWAAYEATDVTYLGGLHTGPVKPREEGDKLVGFIHGEDPMDAPKFSFEMTFGCQNKITGLFKTQLADGIMGMCLKKSSIFQQMYDQGIIAKRSFSLCFVRGEEASRDGTQAGAFTLGGTDEKLHSGPMIYAKGFNARGVMHGVSIRAVYIMGSEHYTAAEANPKNTHKLDVSASLFSEGSIIVDSGTTDTYLTRQLYTPFYETFKAVAGFAYNENGMSLSDEQVKKLPTILIQLEGISSNKLGTPGLAEVIDSTNPKDILIAIPPSHYIEFDSESGKYVGRIFITESYGSVLGANFMRGHDVFFDIIDKLRIGFAPSDCDYLSLSGSTIPPKELSGPSNDDNYDVVSTISSKGSNKFTFDFHQVALILVGVAVTGFVVTGLLKQYRARKYTGINADDNEHLNELHLEAEIQLAEIS